MTNGQGATMEENKDNMIMMSVDKLKLARSYTQSIIEQIIVDARQHGLEMAVGIAYADIEHIYKTVFGLGNQKLE